MGKTKGEQLLGGMGEFEAEQGGGEEQGAGRQRQPLEGALLPLSACLRVPTLDQGLPVRDKIKVEQLRGDEFMVKEGSSDSGLETEEVSHYVASMAMMRMKELEQDREEK